MLVYQSHSEKIHLIQTNLVTVTIFTAFTKCHRSHSVLVSRDGRLIPKKTRNIFTRRHKIRCPPMDDQRQRTVQNTHNRFTLTVSNSDYFDLKQQPVFFPVGSYFSFLSVNRSCWKRNNMLQSTADPARRVPICDSEWLLGGTTGAEKFNKESKWCTWTFPFPTIDFTLRLPGWIHPVMY